MIKAVGAVADGTTLLLLGVNDDDLARLRENQPIEFTMGAIYQAGHQPDVVLLFHKPTDRELETTIEGNIGPDTAVNTVFQRGAFRDQK